MKTCDRCLKRYTGPGFCCAHCSWLTKIQDHVQWLRDGCPNSAFDTLLRNIFGTTP